MIEQPFDYCLGEILLFISRTRMSKTDRIKPFHLQTVYNAIEFSYRPLVGKEICWELQDRGKRPRCYGIFWWPGYVLNAYETETTCFIPIKAILQVLLYKALFDKSYLGSKTTMTSGEWTCLISFATAPLTCSERGGSEKFKMKISVSSGIRTHTPPVHDRKVAAP